MIKREDIKIGLKFVRPWTKRKDVETITDIYETRNSAGELVRTRYVATHEFMGQQMVDSDIVIVSIQRSDYATQLKGEDNV